MDTDPFWRSPDATCFMSPVQHITVAIVSDIHYASVAEQARGTNYELQGVSHPLLRLLLRSYRYLIWKRRPLDQNYLLDDFITAAAGTDYVIANGDYSCNSGFIGVSDDAACDSARECLSKLRQEFGRNSRAILGDHELGKLSFFGGQGGMRLASWHRARRDLNLEPFWLLEIGNYVLVGLTSSIIALPVFEPDTLPSERPEWQQAREQHPEAQTQALLALLHGLFGRSIGKQTPLCASTLETFKTQTRRGDKAPSLVLAKWVLPPWKRLRRSNHSCGIRTTACAVTRKKRWAKSLRTYSRRASDR